jgi:hypothetical protein
MEKENKQIVVNMITCLECGKELVSHNRHDYRTCLCFNEAMIDGGDDYCRYGAKDMSKIKKTTLYEDDDFELIRKYHSRGGRGIDGREPLKYVALCDMNDEWLQAVLDYYPEGSNNYHLRLIKKEINYRKKDEQERT